MAVKTFFKMFNTYHIHKDRQGCEFMMTSIFDN